MSSDALQVVEIAPGSESFTCKSASGRAEWLSRDPIEEEGGIYLYGYVTNDPLSLLDPDGLNPLIWAQRAYNAHKAAKAARAAKQAADALKKAQQVRKYATLDDTGKVHGDLPKPKDLDKYSKEELEKLREDLNKNV